MHQGFSIHEYGPDDEQAILTLNEQSVDATSPMDSDRFNTLLTDGARVVVAVKEKQVVAFMMTFMEASNYDSSNYRWFNGRLKNFVYVDRIVVGEKARGSGIGQRLYTDLMQQCGASYINWVCAEVNSQPPNRQSMVFHQKQGFVEIATKSAGAGKVVSMQVRAIADPQY